MLQIDTALADVRDLDPPVNPSLSGPLSRHLSRTAPYRELVDKRLALDRTSEMFLYRALVRPEKRGDR
jgi:hypothetical protein